MFLLGCWSVLFGMGWKNKISNSEVVLTLSDSCDHLRMRDTRETPGWAGSAPTREDGDKLCWEMHRDSTRVNGKFLLDG